MKDARDLLIEILSLLNEECSKKLECLDDCEYYYPESKVSHEKLKARYEEACTIREKINKIVLEGTKED